VTRGADGTLQLEHPIAGDPAGVDWDDPNGGMAPVCEPCGYRGEPQEHSRAVAAVRRHVASAKHQRSLASDA
jgi:hypothetical protein